MFPAGAAGWGLLLLRACAAGMLVRNSTADTTLSLGTWEIAGVSVLAAGFCLGAFTPVICGISAAVQALLMVCAHGADPFQFVFSFCVTAALFVLGPGAFSVDSRLFGRRLIVRSDSE
jgi:hypothetical protein